ncbi:MAG TPA: MFS transporter [Candidatus Omnitrophica bacterium]|nr:MFS transporter [Candidatus Omnitrophota bacterium]
MKENQKNIIYLGLVSFINDTASKIILPILPLFIREIGGMGLAVGIISGLGESIASIFKMFAGYWSDKAGKRKPFVFWGYLISSAGKFLLVFAKIWPHVLLLRVSERFGKGVRSAPRDAILAASTKREKRGKGFGIHRAMDSGGAVSGAIIAFILFWYLGFDFRSIFLTAGIVSFLSLIPLAPIREKVGERKSKSLKIELKCLSKQLKLFMVIATLFALGNFSYMFFVLRTQRYFEGKLSIGIPIFLYILYNTSYTLFTIPSGILSDKIGRKSVLFAGYGLFGLVCLGFIFSKSLLFFIILFVLFGLNYALVNATERAFVSDLSDEDLRGTALGTFHMLTSLATLPAGLIAGLLWDVNTTYTFIYGALISFVVIVLFLVLYFPHLLDKSG